MRSEFIDVRSVQKLMQGMSYANSTAFALSIATGWRIGDVLKLKTSQLGETITITEQKTGKTSTKKIPYDLLRRLIDISGEEYVFVGRKPYKHRTRQAVWADVRRASLRMGIEAHVSPHTARKIYAVNDYKANGIKHTQKELNHRDTALTELYAFSDTMIPDYKLEELAATIAQKVLDKIKSM